MVWLGLGIFWFLRVVSAPSLSLVNVVFSGSRVSHDMLCHVRDNRL